jgi:anti-sigma B factor antagonist
VVECFLEGFGRVRTGQKEATACLTRQIRAVLKESTVELSLNHRQEGNRTILDVAGEVDVYTAPKLREKLVELVGDGNYHIIVDMTKVEFLDSTGLGVLVGGLKRVRSHEGSLALVCNQERILKIFRITGLTKVFPIHDSLDEALQDAAAG